VSSVVPDGPGTTRVITAQGELDAGLVVAADGIGSATRAALFPGHPGGRAPLRSSGGPVARPA
jgi:2-polyprenyl-6-methoxyphenol hydroxylase-like FAD-dependent oxidoreductase